MDLKFRIYYAMWDQTVQDYRHWTFEGIGFKDAIKAPTDGVQIIVQENKDKASGYDLLSQRDYYVWRGDQGWIVMDEGGFHTYMREVGFPKLVLFGYNLRNDAFHECHNRALREGLGA